MASTSWLSPTRRSTIERSPSCVGSTVYVGSRTRVGFGIFPYVSAMSFSVFASSNLPVTITTELSGW